MITFKQFITELFDSSSYEYTKHTKGPRDHSAHFKTNNGNKYHVDIHHGPTGGADVSFHDSDSDGSRGSTEINKKERTSSVKVFSTVKHVMHDHLKNHPNIKHITFSAHHTEPSRVRLYKHLSNKFATKHTETKSGRGKKSAHTSYTIHRDDIK